MSAKLDVPSLRQAIDDAYHGRHEGRISNRTSLCAMELIRGIFGWSNQTVDLLTEKLNPVAYENEILQSAAVDFLNRGGRLRVLIETPKTWTELRNYPFIEALLCRGRCDRLEIRWLPDAFARHKWNFAIGDGRHFRLEPDRKELTGEADFSKPEDSAPLVRYFEEVWPNGLEIEGRSEAPSRIDLVHETDGDGTHIFHAPRDLRGLMIGVENPEEGLDDAARIASDLVALSLGRAAHYRLVRAPDGSLDGNYLTLA